MSSPIINSGSSEGQNTQGFVDIEADFIATVNAATGNTQHTGTVAAAAQLGGQVAAPIQNNDIGDPWQGQSLPQRTHDNIDGAAGGHWDAYNAVRNNAAVINNQQYPFQQLPGQGAH